MINRIVLGLCSLFLSLCVYGQEWEVIEQELAYHADVMTNASKAIHRQQAETAFRTNLIQALAKDGSFERKLESLEWVKVLVPQDSSVKVITWQLEGEEAKYSYFGVVQKADGSMIQLHNKRRLSSEYANYDQNTWYGALYYGIESIQLEDKTVGYLLIGFNAKDQRSNQKMADIMTLEGDRATFGAPVFDVVLEGQSDVKNRIIIEYNEAASGKVQLDRDRSLLVYDHIIVIEGGPEGPMFVPDGSYHAFDYKNGKWKFIEKLYNHKVNTPPGEGIQEDGDLVGKKKN